MTSLKDLDSFASNPNPKPQTPNPKPQTPNPKPQTPKETDYRRRDINREISFKSSKKHREIINL
jgi:hypothetical protein